MYICILLYTYICMYVCIYIYIYIYIYMRTFQVRHGEREYACWLSHHKEAQS